MDPRERLADDRVLTEDETALLFRDLIAKLRAQGWSDEVIAARINATAKQLGIDLTVRIVRRDPD